MNSLSSFYCNQKVPLNSYKLYRIMRISRYNDEYYTLGDIGYIKSGLSEKYYDTHPNLLHLFLYEQPCDLITRIGLSHHRLETPTPTVKVNNFRYRKKGDFMILQDKVKVLVGECENSVVTYCMNSIKNHFGREFEYLASRDIYLINMITNRFLKKYDKRFKHHVVAEHRGMQNVIMNNQFFIPLDKNTFIYVATGNKIGHIEERYMMNSDAPSAVDLYLYIFGKNCRKYIKELNVLTHKVMVNGELGIYIIDKEKSSYEDSEKRESLDVLYSKLQPRYLETLFFSHNEKDIICNHIDKFNNNEKFYKDRQLLYKTGILLHGEPGTGKSSLVKAIATKYNRSIVAINMTNIKQIDLNKLTQSINVDEEKKYIILLEDIDTLFLNRVNGESDKDDQAVINKLLQFLDSNTSPTNVIFIATTNHIERLDEALLREGRFDLKVQIHPLKTKEAIMFGESFGLSTDRMKQILDDIDNEFKIHDNYNQSRLQARILGRLENKSIESIKNIHGEMEE